jgi:hypothetical protein
MTYSIYVDLAFGWAFAVNFVLLYISERLLKNRIKLHRLCIDATLISIICTGEYVMLYSCNIVLQNTLYVLTYFLLLYLYHRLRCLRVPLLLTYAFYVLVSFVIALLLMLVRYSLGKGIFASLTVCVLFAIPAIYIIYCNIKQNLSLKSCVHHVVLTVRGNDFPTSAYMDTGNSLRDLSGQNVMIADCSYAYELLGDAYLELLDTYRQNKSFDYVKAGLISDIILRPIPYRTLSSEFCIMPGFTADRIFYEETGRQYRNITIAISHNRLMLPGNAKLLSNLNLRP